MKRRIVISALLVCCLVGLMVFASCNGGGGGGGSTTPTQLFNVTGFWFIISPDMGNLTMTITETGGTITGTAKSSVAAGGADDGTVISGSNNNNAVSITIQFSDQLILVLEGTVTSETQMSGTTTSYYPWDSPGTWSHGTWGADKQ